MASLSRPLQTHEDCAQLGAAIKAATEQGRSLSIEAEGETFEVSFKEYSEEQRVAYGRTAGDNLLFVNLDSTFNTRARIVLVTT